MSRSPNTIRIGDVIRLPDQSEGIAYLVRIDQARGRVVIAKSLRDFSDWHFGNGDRTPAILRRGELAIVSHALGLESGGVLLRTGLETYDLHTCKFHRYHHIITKIDAARRKASFARFTP